MSENAGPDQAKNAPRRALGDRENPPCRSPCRVAASRSVLGLIWFPVLDTRDITGHRPPTRTLHTAAPSPTPIMLVRSKWCRAAIHRQRGPGDDQPPACTWRALEDRTAEPSASCLIPAGSQLTRATSGGQGVRHMIRTHARTHALALWHSDHAPPKASSLTPARRKWLGPVRARYQWTLRLSLVMQGVTPRLREWRHRVLPPVSTARNAAR